ncbi:hypothetical protein RB195_018773 [Necator americanus]|uniref:DUF5641 domain-containing protein n=1 Tax=Necator americanus TaxID=51031 RepID=A0ABR1CDZ5_NECAM
MDNKRGTTMKPQEGEVVLSCDSLQPRNTWKIGRTVELRTNAADTVREVLTELSNKTRLRRSMNRAVPLKKGHESAPDPEPTPPSSTSTPKPRYNLRKRKLIQNSE